jgi:hypothetical protein
MRFCPNCGRQLLDDAKFCDVCGERMPAVNSSPGPAEHADQTDAVPGGKTETAAAEAVPSAPDGKEKKPRKKAVLLGAIGAAALVAIALLAVFLAGGRKIPENFALFIMDNELYFTDFSKKGATELTEDLLGGDALKNYFDESAMADLSYIIGNYAFAPKSLKRIFYPDRFGSGMNRFSLSYLEPDKASKGGVRIDGGIKAYTADAEGEHLLYLKGNSNALYYSDIASNFKIAENVASFYLSEDGMKVFFVYDTGEGCFWYPDKDSVKVAADIEPGSIRHVSADLSAVYYTTKDSSLYKLDERPKRGLSLRPASRTLWPPTIPARCTTRRPSRRTSGYTTISSTTTRQPAATKSETRFKTAGIR